MYIFNINRNITLCKERLGQPCGARRGKGIKPWINFKGYHAKVGKTHDWRLKKRWSRFARGSSFT